MRTLRCNYTTIRLSSLIWICLPCVHIIQRATSLPWRHLRQHCRRSRWSKFMHCLSFRFCLPSRHRHIFHWFSPIEMRTRFLLPLRDQFYKIVPLRRWQLQYFTNSHSAKRMFSLHSGTLLSSRLKQRKTVPSRILLLGICNYAHTLS